MFEIERPKIECKELNDYYGCFVVEPLERGFGTTLGNCLRRVLLSSMPGAAASSVKIDGVLHEFSTIPGVKEDVTEIILNIKELRVRLLGESSSVHVVIDAKGEGKVFAGDIIHDADVEIINPDLHIATLSEGANLYMDIVLEKGKGYVSAEKNKKPNMPIGVIAIDSIFTPITKVNFRVEDTRVVRLPTTTSSRFRSGQTEASAPKRQSAFLQGSCSTTFHCSRTLPKVCRTLKLSAMKSLTAKKRYTIWRSKNSISRFVRITASNVPASTPLRSLLNATRRK